MHFNTDTPAPFDRLTALSWPKGLSKGSPVKAEGASPVLIPHVDLYHNLLEPETVARKAEFPCQKGSNLFNILKT
jgi:hypothetical protein